MVFSDNNLDSEQGANKASWQLAVRNERDVFLVATRDQYGPGFNYRTSCQDFMNSKISLILPKVTERRIESSVARCNGINRKGITFALISYTKYSRAVENDLERL